MMYSASYSTKRDYQLLFEEVQTNFKESTEYTTLTLYTLHKKFLGSITGVFWKEVPIGLTCMQCTPCSDSHACFNLNGSTVYSFIIIQNGVRF